ncbi:N-ethylmaleimide reductase [Pedobacter cryoconitis]|uniref:N-ethylmaleimide reductase n=1 Tax=Pedobacter cryoconitis TaxID=188932 RepID=A0A7W8ZNG3_9SPHI|nr:alkene reductase [Pedobacter cryoconitis]MBB5637249.1 N-ethylmaleimide reductase [Pedobacter cryoconitis]
MKNQEILHQPYTLGSLVLKNRFVMAPMTRSRAINNLPNDLMVEYYRQRSGAGLIISEALAPSANATGYVRVPGIYKDAQIEGWKKITDVVHENDAKIFAQLMHTGWASHVDNLPEGGEILAPSALVSTGSEVWTDTTKSMQKSSLPREMTKADIEATIQEFTQAALNAVKAGFDGIELHGANGYLIDEFLNPASNHRTDEYGGSIENRARFYLEVTQSVANAIGKEKVGTRISPYGVFNGMVIYPEMEETFIYLAAELNKIGIVYLHVADHSSMGTPPLTASVKDGIRANFKGTLIGVNNYTAETALADIESGYLDLPAFGRAFIANPDLPSRILNNLPLNEPDKTTLYASGSTDEKGYTDYAFAGEVISK